MSPANNFGPVKWTKYYEREEVLDISRGQFHFYAKGSTGPILLCLHGGGYSGLTWALFAVRPIDINKF